MSMRVPTPYSLPSPCARKGSWSTVWNHTLQSMSKLLCTYKKTCLIPFPAYLSNSISHSLGTHVCTYTHTSPHYHAVFCLCASCTSARNIFFPKNLFKTQLRYHVPSKLSLSLLLQERWVRLKDISPLPLLLTAPEHSYKRHIRPHPKEAVHCSTDAFSGLNSCQSPITSHMWAS